MNFWDIVCKIGCLRVSNIPDYKIFLLFPSGYSHQYCHDRPPYRQSCRSPRDTGYKKSIHHFLLDMYSLGKCNTNMRLRHLLAMMHYTFPPGNSSPQAWRVPCKCPMPNHMLYTRQQWRQISFSSLTPILQQKTTGNNFKWLEVSNYQIQ